jgi:hypothetical protein
MSLPCSRLSETSFSILSRQYQCNAIIEPGLERSGWFTATLKLVPRLACLLLLT